MQCLTTASLFSPSLLLICTLCYNKGEVNEEEGTNGHNDGQESGSHSSRWRRTHVTSRGTPAIMNGMGMWDWNCQCVCDCVCVRERDRERERGAL